MCERCVTLFTSSVDFCISGCNHDRRLGFDFASEPSVQVCSKQYLIPNKYSFAIRSNLMRLYSPVHLTGNLIMIEKLVLGGDLNRDLPIFSPYALTSVPSRQAVLINSSVC